MTAVSYAQANEDLLLFDALREVSPEVGFYIDVGANDPEKDSVTKLFYDQGWRGVNIEPSPEWFARPPRRGCGTSTSKLWPRTGPETSCFTMSSVSSLARSWTSMRSVIPISAVVALVLHEDCHPNPALREACAKRDSFPGNRCRGCEAEVIDGMDFRPFRPWILVIETVEPNTLPATYPGWDQRVRDAGYRSCSQTC
jgi:hypothetical protein